MTEQRLTDDRIREIGKDIFGIDLALDGHLLDFARAILSADRGEPVGVVCAVSVSGVPMNNSTGVDWLKAVPVGSWLYAAAPSTPSIQVATMKESHQTTYWVHISVGDRELTPYKSLVKGRAEYEAASWRWLLLGEAKPDILAFDTEAASSTPQPAPEPWRVEAVRWLRRKAADQATANAKWPRHAEAYPTWETRVRDLGWLADELEAEQEASPYGMDQPMGPPIVNKFGDTLRPEWQKFMETATPQPAPEQVPVETLLEWAVLDGVVRLSKVMDADLQDALRKFAGRFGATPQPDTVQVPREPTQDMLYAMAELDGWKRGDREHPMLTRWEDYWNAAIAAQESKE